MQPQLPLPTSFAVWTWSPVDLINHLWQSTVVALAILLLIAICGRVSARTRLTLGWMALAKFAIPLALVAQLATLIGVTPDRWLQSHTFTVPAAVPAVVVKSFLPALAPELSSAAAADPAAAADGTAMKSGMVEVDLGLFFAGLWLVGFLIFYLPWLIGGIQLRRKILSDASPLPAELEKRMRDAAARASLPLPRRRIAVRDGFGPGLLGVFAPILIIPRGLEESLSRAELEAVLLHELVHLRRRDSFWGAVQVLTVSLLWFNPLAWIIGNRVRHEMEQSCDEEVLAITGDPDTYAGGILKVVRHALGLPEPSLLGIITAPVVSRIRNILRHSRRRDRRWLRITIIGGGAALLFLGGHAGSLAIAAARDSQPDKTEISPEPTLLSRAGISPATDERDAGRDSGVPTGTSERVEPDVTVGGNSATAATEFGATGERPAVIHLSTLERVTASSSPDLSGAAGNAHAAVVPIPNSSLAPGIRETIRQQIRNLRPVDQAPDWVGDPAIRAELRAAATAESSIASVPDDRSRGIPALGWDATAVAGNPHPARVDLPTDVQVTGTLQIVGLMQGDEPPQPTQMPMPDYPSTELSDYAPGEVQLSFTVNPNGEVAQVHVVSSTRYELEAPAIAAVESWNFRPGFASGTAKPFTLRASFSFPAVTPTDTPKAKPAAAIKVAQGRADTASAEPQSTSDGGIFNLKELDEPPRLTYQPLPIYPSELRRRGIEGEVLLGLVVAADGSIEDLHVIDSTQIEFERAATQAVEKWTFAPGTKGGHGVPVRIEVPIRFSPQI